MGWFVAGLSTFRSLRAVDQRDPVPERSTDDAWIRSPTRPTASLCAAILWSVHERPTVAKIVKPCIIKELDRLLTALPTESKSGVVCGVAGRRPTSSRMDAA